MCQLTDNMSMCLKTYIKSKHNALKAYHNIFWKYRKQYPTSNKTSEQRQKKATYFIDMCLKHVGDMIRFKYVILYLILGTLKSIITKILNSEENSKRKVSD